MSNFRIGQVIEFTDDIPIETALGGKQYTIKKGNKGRILRKVKDDTADVAIINGPAAGKRILIQAEIKGVDTEAIAQQIVKRINNALNFMDLDEDTLKAMQEEVADILDDYHIGS